MVMAVWPWLTWPAALPAGFGRGCCGGQCHVCGMCACVRTGPPISNSVLRSATHASGMHAAGVSLLPCLSFTQTQHLPASVCPEVDTAAAVSQCIPGRTAAASALSLKGMLPTAGAFQQLAASPYHELGFLSLLFQLTQSSAVCNRLLADCSPSAAKLQKGTATRSGAGQQAQQTGGSAASLDATVPALRETVDVDMADAEGTARWAFLRHMRSLQCSCDLNSCQLCDLPRPAASI